MPSVADGYIIALASEEHLPFLAEIERAAAQLFVGWDVPASVILESTSLEEFRDNQKRGLLWVALSPAGQPVGFAVVEPMEDTAHLEELDVHPSHGRRGIGSALVRAVCDWARASGLRAVTLTTYRDIPWNAPLYAGLGFRALLSEQLDPLLEERVREEAARGLAAERRVVMQFDIGEAGVSAGE